MSNPLPSGVRSGVEPMPRMVVIRMVTTLDSRKIPSMAKISMMVGNFDLSGLSTFCSNGVLGVGTTTSVGS